MNTTEEERQLVQSNWPTIEAELDKAQAAIDSFACQIAESTYVINSLTGYSDDTVTLDDVKRVHKADLDEEYDIAGLKEYLRSKYGVK